MLLVLLSYCVIAFVLWTNLVRQKNTVRPCGFSMITRPGCSYSSHLLVQSGSLTTASLSSTNSSEEPNLGTVESESFLHTEVELVLRVFIINCMKI